MNYKNIIKNQKTRFKILEFLSFVPDELMLKMQYRIKLNRKLNISAPKRFTEKIQWYKINYKNPVMEQCVDKLLVRKYIHNKNLEKYLNKLYFYTDDVNDIKYDKLPNKFVAKTTNGGGGQNVIICKNKSGLNFKKMKSDLQRWLTTDKKSSGREWVYDYLNPKIIIEEYLENEDGKEINDYKFLCFNGKVEYIILDTGRYENHKRNIYDANWNFIPVTTDVRNSKEKIEQPNKLEEMIKIAEKLSEDFPFVRVDLYYVNQEIYFGELTYFPWSGYVQFHPDKFDYELGRKFILPE